MDPITITLAEADIDRVIDMAQERPVFINDQDEENAVMISYELYQTFVDLEAK